MKYEVAIVGAGASGLMTAYFLLEKGVERIVVIEGSYIGSGSTGRCGTGIRASFTSEENIVMMREAIELWKKLSAELDFYYRQWGYVWLLTDERLVSAYKEFSRLHNKLGVPTEVKSPEALDELIPFMEKADVLAVLHDKIAGKADPFECLFALSRHVRERGGEIRTHCKATKILLSGKEVRGVLTEEGTVECDNLVVAAGYGTRKLVKTVGVDLPLENVVHHIILTERFRESLKPMVVHTATGAYMTQTKEGHWITGVEIEEEAGGPFSVRHDFIPKLMGIWSRYFPFMRNMHLLRYWVGYYVMSPDHHPILGPLPGIEGLYVMAGYSGHGFMMAPSAGKCVAEWIVDGKPSIPQAERLTYERILEGRLIEEKAVIG